MNHLLYCAVSSLIRDLPRWESIDSADDLILVNEFLRQGRNPNWRQPHGTIWSVFLDEMHRRLFDDRKPNELRRAYMQTTVAFVENGADLHSAFTVSNPSISLDGMTYSLNLDVAASAIIELCLPNQLEQSHLRHLCAIVMCKKLANAWHFFFEKSPPSPPKSDIAEATLKMVNFTQRNSSMATTNF